MEKEATTEQKILEAAESEFLTEGLAGARMQNIATRAGINKALLHYYFRSKDKLFEVVFNWKMNQFVPHITAMIQDESIPFLDKLDGFVLTYLNFLKKNSYLPIFIISTLHRNPDLVKSIQYPVGKALVVAMKKEIERGNLRPVDVHQFWLSLIGMCIFPFLARPMFSHLFELSPADYDKIIAERHIHVMQYARAILTI